MHQGPNGWWVQDEAGESVWASHANGMEAERRMSLQKVCWHPNMKSGLLQCPDCLMSAREAAFSRREIAAKEHFITNGLLRGADFGDFNRD